MMIVELTLGQLGDAKPPRTYKGIKESTRTRRISLDAALYDAVGRAAQRLGYPSPREFVETAVDRAISHWAFNRPLTKQGKKIQCCSWHEHYYLHCMPTWMWEGQGTYLSVEDGPGGRGMGKLWVAGS